MRSNLASATIRSTSRTLLMLLTSLVTASLGIASAPAASSPADESFYFPKGTRWVYEGKANGVKRTVAQEVLRVSTEDLVWKGEPATVFRLAVRTLNVETGRFEMGLMTSYLALENGYLVTGSQEGPPVRIYKLNSRKGDTWPCIDPRIGKHPDLVFAHLGEEETTVPAGTFRNARHIQVAIPGEESRHVGDLYIVPRIGIIKSRAFSEGHDKRMEVTLELKRFSPVREF